ncbi:MAG: diacylglycerol kinase family protein [Pseudomonadota bacterium]
MKDHAVLIVNPRSGRNQTGRRWKDMEALIQRSLPDVVTRMTESAGHATELTREALRQGASLVVAVGGDGTNNEVVNGFFEPSGQAIAPEASFGFIAAGTGSDLGRSFGHGGGLRAAAQRIAGAAPRPLDLGRITYTGHDGQERQRLFVNIASFGVSGLVVRTVNSRTSGGKLAYAMSTAGAIFRYKSSPVTLQIDDDEPRTLDLMLCAVANGQFFGGGMQIAPHAVPDDGSFDVVTVAGWKPMGFLSNAPKVYSGSHLSLAGVEEHRGVRRLRASPSAGAQVLIDLDGEQPGVLPASFEILPGAIRIRG